MIWWCVDTHVRRLVDYESIRYLCNWGTVVQIGWHCWYWWNTRWDTIYISTLPILIYYTFAGRSVGTYLGRHGGVNGVICSNFCGYMKLSDLNMSREKATFETTRRDELIAESRNLCYWYNTSSILKPPKFSTAGIYLLESVWLFWLSLLLSRYSSVNARASSPGPNMKCGSATMKHEMEEQATPHAIQRGRFLWPP